MIRFSQEKVLLLHQLITEETGGDNGVRDYGLLDSTLESVYQTFDGQELYPTKQEKGARLGYTLISNHAFVDGNKRIGMYVMALITSTTISIREITVDWMNCKLPFLPQNCLIWNV